MKYGILIGYSNSGRKKLLTSCGVEKLNQKLMVRRIKGFIDTKEDVQQGLIELVKQVPQTDLIFIAISYQRLDIMKKKLALLMNHFKPYSDQVYLIITNFEQSDDLDDIIEIKNRLADPWNIKNIFMHKFENNLGYIIDSNKIQSYGLKFFQQLSQTKQVIIKFDSMKMNLEIQYDERILQMLQALVNNQGKQGKQMQNDISIIKFKDTSKDQKELFIKQQVTNAIKNSKAINNSPQINVKQKMNYQQQSSQPRQDVDIQITKQQQNNVTKRDYIDIRQKEAYQDTYPLVIKNNSRKLKSKEPFKKSQQKDFQSINKKQISQISEKNRQIKQQQMYKIKFTENKAKQKNK